MKKSLFLIFTFFLVLYLFSACEKMEKPLLGPDPGDQISGKKNTGTHVRFWPEAKYFDSIKFSVSRLKHVLRAKAVLCPGLHVVFFDEQSGETDEWYYEDGLRDYLTEALQGFELLPAEPFIGAFSSSHEAVDWALACRCLARY